MESILALTHTEQDQALLHWLQHDCDLSLLSLTPIPGDAGFRRYFRLMTPTGSLIVMDISQSQENGQAYIAIADALRSMGLHTPQVIAKDLARGFFLITDFGDVTYLKTLSAHNADQLYTRALEAMLILQDCRHVPGWTIQPFTQEVMWQEWVLCKEWFLEKYLSVSWGREEKRVDDFITRLIDSIAAQPQVFMHRDYHSANLMVLPNEQVGLLDFQDAFIGPITYDLASLLRDCYIDWPETKVIQWALAYKEKLHECQALSSVDDATFLYWFDAMSVQRHLKALLTFARKHIRDQQSRYLQFIPRTLNYLCQVSARYPEWAVLHDYLHERVQPLISRERLCEP